MSNLADILEDELRAIIVDERKKGICRGTPLLVAELLGDSDVSVERRERLGLAIYRQAIADVAEVTQALVVGQLRPVTVEPIEPIYECSKCRAPKGEHALGQSCNNNCGGRVVQR